MDGFTGGACERLACPTSGSANGCSGNGECLSLKEAAAKKTSNGIAAATTYGATQAAGTWDHNKIYGCVCDDQRYTKNVYGKTGHDCSVRKKRKIFYRLVFFWRFFENYF
jgi:hypothetical protein